MAIPGATLRAVACEVLACEVLADEVLADEVLADEVVAGAAATLAWSAALADGAAVARPRTGMASVVNANAAVPRHRVLNVGPGRLKPLMLIFS